MCQLLGMNSKQPADICFSFTGFRQRGGVTDHHADGWGIAFFEGRAARVFHDPQSSSVSPLADLICAHPIPSTTVIAHIRKATCGEVRLQNTHPFQRELWGQHWVFAHNGTLRDFHPELDGEFRPVGNTDSELVFCWLLQNLREVFGQNPPDRASLWPWLHRLASEASRYGALNFLLSNGDCLFAHCSTNLHYLIRGTAMAGAHLIDQDLSADLTGSGDPQGRAIVVATTPLTDNEPWISMPAGSLWCFAEGQVWSNSVGPPDTP